jgi:hypothetical protein
VTEIVLTWYTTIYGARRRGFNHPVGTRHTALGGIGHALAPVAQFNEINANATDGGNGLPVITNLPTATNPYTSFSTGGQKFCRLSQ